VRSNTQRSHLIPDTSNLIPPGAAQHIPEYYNYYARQVRSNGLRSFTCPQADKTRANSTIWTNNLQITLRNTFDPKFPPGITDNIR